MANTFRLQVVTPEGELLNEDVAELLAPGFRGEFGVLPEHARYVTALGVGELRYKDTNGASHSLAVARGFAEVAQDHVTILAQTAEIAEQIDVARAEAAVRRAEQIIAEPDDESDIGRATQALERSMARLRVAKARGVKAPRATIQTTETAIPGEARQD